MAITKASLASMVSRRSVPTILSIFLTAVIFYMVVYTRPSARHQRSEEAAALREELYEQLESSHTKVQELENRVMAFDQKVWSDCSLPDFGAFFDSVIGKIACYSSGDIVCESIRISGQWDADVEKALKPYMTSETTFVDVGSNIGWYTFLMARTNPVVAYEPFLKNLQLQTATRCANGNLAQRIELHGYGLSDQTIHCDLYQIPTVNIGDTHSACDDETRKKLLKDGYQKLGESVVHRLDDVASERLMQAEKVMKIDIEGHEYEMLLGAKKFLTSHNPPKAIYMEMFLLDARIGGKTKKQLAIEFLAQCQYKLATIDRNAPNYLFVMNRM